ERVLNFANGYARGEAPAFEDEHRMRHKDGSTRWFLSRGAIVPSAAGEPPRILGTSIDVTERRRIADELCNLEILWTAMLASSSEQIAIMDRSGFIIAINDAWSRYARESGDGRFRRASIGTNYLEAFRGDGNDAEAARAAQGIAAVLDGSEVGFHLEYDCSCSARLRWFELSTIPLRRPEGGAVVSYQDITRRKRVEIEPQQHR